MSTDGGINEQNVAYTDNGILFALKRKEILTQAPKWMHLEAIKLSEIARQKRTNTV